LKNINFVYYNTDYRKVLDSLIDPILPYLNNYTKNSEADENSLNVNFFREDPKKVNVFCSHGIACKNWRNAWDVKDYDYIFVSGELWKEKLIQQGLDKNKIFINGYTKLDPIFQGKYKKNTYDKKVILFAPTHIAIPSISLKNRFEENFKYFDKYKIIDSSHPTAKSDQSPTLQALVDADIVISDSGSLLYEAWLLGKQVVFVDWLIKEEVHNHIPYSFEDFIYEKEVGLHAKNIKEMCELVDFASENELDKNVVDFMESIFPTSLRGKSGEMTAQILKELAKL